MLDLSLCPLNYKSTRYFPTVSTLMTPSRSFLRFFFQPFQFPNSWLIILLTLSPLYWNDHCDFWFLTGSYLILSSWWRWLLQIQFHFFTQQNPMTRKEFSFSVLLKKEEIFSRGHHAQIFQCVIGKNYVTRTCLNQFQSKNIESISK